MSEFRARTDHEKLWKKFEESFGQRRWKSLRMAWPDFIRNPDVPVAGVPEMTLSEFVGQGGVLMGVPEKRKLTNTLNPRGEVPEIVFREAVLWMHKAFHVLGMMHRLGIVPQRLLREPLRV